MASAAEVLFGQVAPTEVSFRNKVIGVISLQRVALGILFLPLVWGAMALAGVQFGDLRLLLVIIIALLGSFAVNVINDIIDMDRDKWK
jgi:4-hydroxybenzoate polyprenyltransferase